MSASSPSQPPIAPDDVQRRDLQAAYRELAALEHLAADLHVDIERQRQRIATLEHAALGLGQQ